ncbi:ribbon-helix-helix domain-containing protein [Rhodopila sp.]|uniref:ribbon-helix-helix domain-containing protein n=1 Tax=Rhodopila sp. TaxID=2480087 RepID=UPI003D0BA2A6
MRLSTMECVMASSRLVFRPIGTARGQIGIKLEPEFWHWLSQICERERIHLRELISQISEACPDGNLASTIRVFVLDYFCDAATESGHTQAGHGEMPSSILALRSLKAA